MERLKDAHFEHGSLEAEASVLLHGAEPYSVPASLKRKVRVRLVEAAPRRRIPVLLRAAIVAGVLAIVAVSLAAVGHVWQKAPASRPAKLAVHTPSASAPVGVGGHELDVVARASELAAPVASSAVGSPKHGAADVHADPRRELPRDAASVTEASLVYDTARALRNEGDKARAARVLDDYFKRYPHGALAEEAQALAIEIAVARGDARAKSLASRYLSTYPTGHFRAKAERVLGGAP